MRFANTYNRGKKIAWAVFSGLVKYFTYCSLSNIIWVEKCNLRLFWRPVRDAIDNIVSLGKQENNNFNYNRNGYNIHNNITLVNA